MWELSFVVDTAARQPIAVAMEGADLERAILEANRRLEAGEYRSPAWKKPALLIQRTDRTAEAQFQHWFDEFYDLDKRNAKRRRYKKPAIEKAWEEWIKAEARVARSDRQVANASHKRDRSGG